MQKSKKAPCVLIYTDLQVVLSGEKVQGAEHYAYFQTVCLERCVGLAGACINLYCLWSSLGKGPGMGWLGTGVGETPALILNFEPCEGN